MSCSSWTNSISASGAASCSFGRMIRDDFFGRTAALAARLQADEDVAGVLCCRKQSELRAGPPRVGRHLGGIAMIFSSARTC